MQLNINIGGGCGCHGGMPMGGMGSQQQMQMMRMMQMMQMMQMFMGMMGMMMGGAQQFPMGMGHPGFGMGGMDGISGGGMGFPGGAMGNFLGGGMPMMGGGGFGGGGFGGGMPVQGGHAGSPVPFNGYVPPSSQGGQRAVDVARQFLGQRSRDIKGQMPHFRAAGGLTNNCADFVSSALRSANMLGGHEVNCRRLEARLQREGWRQIPASEAGPGDVAFNRSRGHVVLCQGNGQMIGSNNVRRGLQYITEKRLPQNWIVYRKA